MKRIFLGCSLAIINCYASTVIHRSKFAQARAIQPPPEIPDDSWMCNRDHIADLAKGRNPGEVFSCEKDTQKWSCVVTTTGYACDVDDEPVPVPPPPTPTPTPIIIDDISRLEIDTSIDMTVLEGNWLQDNVIKHRKPKLLYRDEGHENFREAASRAGTLYLAKGVNGAILGALTYVNIAGIQGWNSFGPEPEPQDEKTILFSVTNKIIYPWVSPTK